jgi:hypothetical protein
MLQCLVNLRHREHLGRRCHLRPSGKLHQLTQLERRTGCGTGHTSVAANQRKGRNFQRFQHCADGMERAAVGQRFKVRLPLQIDVHGVDNQIELARQRF